jgi:hypothetical protein
MSIRPSSAIDVARLIDLLSSPDASRRDGAAARLTVIGPRAASKLLALAKDDARPDAARVAALGALEPLSDARTLAAASALIDHPREAVAAAALRVVGACARGPEPTATRAFERLAELVLNRQAPAGRRLTALTLLDSVSTPVLRGLLAALNDDPSEDIRARVARWRAGAMAPLASLVEQGLPDDPLAVEAIVREEGAATEVTHLRHLVELLRAQQAIAGTRDRPRWMAVRGLVHQQLAARHSRLGVYDLREALASSAGALPVGFLAAAAAVGDASCLEPMAAAWAAAAETPSHMADRWWRTHLADAFAAIVAREGLTRRHAVLRRILERIPAAGVLVAAAKKQ